MLTDEQIIEGNKLMAEFMGADIVEPIGYTKRNIKFPIETFGLYVYNQNDLQYHNRIEWIWPVMHKCMELAQANQKFLATPWFAIAMFLYKVPLETEETFCELYEAVVFFIKVYTDLKGIAPVCDNV